MGVEGASFNGFVNDESLWNLFWCFLCKFYYRNRPILKTLGQFQNLGFVIMSTRENIRLIARTPFTSNNCKRSARTLKMLRTPKVDYCIKQWFSTTTSLIKLGICLKGKNLLPEGAILLPEGANSFFQEQFLKVWRITFTTLGPLPWV